jgi:hypothetical protein
MTDKTKRPNLLLAAFSLCILVILNACVSEKSPSEPAEEIHEFSMIFTLTNGSGDSAHRLALRMHSNLQDTLGDTLFIAPLAPESSSTFRQTFSLRPLRWWKLDVWTLDDKDSILRYEEVGPFAYRGGGQDSLVLSIGHGEVVCGFP